MAHYRTHRRRWTFLLLVLAAIGATIYAGYEKIVDFVILSAIFYGWGLGFFGQTNVPLLIGLAAGIYFLLMLLTLIGFRYHRQRPLEQVWRAFSYGNQR